MLTSIFSRERFILTIASKFGNMLRLPVSTWGMLSHRADITSTQSEHRAINCLPPAQVRSIMSSRLETRLLSPRALYHCSIPKLFEGRKKIQYRQASFYDTSRFPQNKPFYLSSMTKSSSSSSSIASSLSFVTRGV